MEEKIRVALCDDARGVKMMVRHFLEQDGDMEVVSSTNTSEELLDDVARQLPHVLLLDVVLPDAPDLDPVMRQLRVISPATAIVLMSNLPPFRLEQETARVGADGWLVKATKPDELRAAVRRAAGVGHA